MRESLTESVPAAGERHTDCPAVAPDACTAGSACQGGHCPATLEDAWCRQGPCTWFITALAAGAGAAAWLPLRPHHPHPPAAFSSTLCVSSSSCCNLWCGCQLAKPQTSLAALKLLAGNVSVNHACTQPWTSSQNPCFATRMHWWRAHVASVPCCCMAAQMKASNVQLAGFNPAEANLCLWCCQGECGQWHWEWLRQWAWQVFSSYLCAPRAWFGSPSSQQGLIASASHHHCPGAALHERATATTCLG